MMTPSQIKRTLEDMDSKLSRVIRELSRIKRDPEDAANAERYAKNAISHVKQVRGDIDQLMRKGLTT
jgi:hypothetical protein